MKKLADSEFEIMKVLWGTNRQMTSNEILDGVNGILDWKLASLMTALSRMVDKGFVYCDRSTRTNYYTAVVSEDEYKVYESETLIDKLYDNSATNLISSLYKKRKISREEINKLKLYMESIDDEEIEMTEMTE